MNKSFENHWNDVYGTKSSNELSWTQSVPKTSLEFIRSYNLNKTASIIDIGGGDSYLVDYLLQEAYQNITVLDISEKALMKAKKRLGRNASKINWVVGDITKYTPERKFDVWHDRATFHFLTTDEEKSHYLNIARNYVSGFLTVGTFSETGPVKCSGLTINRYSEENLVKVFQHGFKKLHCIKEDHITPFGTLQNFQFCSFIKQDNISAGI
ncbi:MAG: hypothetical protein RL115_345 [Bacteroidota bacterium]|jgi:SAM-dependent methyltransferase